MTESCSLYLQIFSHNCNSILGFKKNGKVKTSQNIEFTSCNSDVLAISSLYLTILSLYFAGQIFLLYDTLKEMIHRCYNRLKIVT